MFNEAIDQLSELGLKKNEAQVYLACLRKPYGIHVHEIADLTDVKRSSIDVILQRLRERGFVIRFKEGQRWLYRAETPEKIAFSFEEKIADFKSFAPYLSQAMSSGPVPNVRFYEGISGVSKVYDDILLATSSEGSTKGVLTISSGKDLLKLLPGHHKQFIRKRINRQIRVRLLAPDNSLTRKLFASEESSLRHTRYFNEQAHPFKVEVNIYANKIALVNFSDPGIMATVIENNEIAASFRSIFELLWLGSTD